MAFDMLILNLYWYIFLYVLPLRILYVVARCCKVTIIENIPYSLALYESIGVDPLGTPCEPDVEVCRFDVVMTNDDAPTPVYGDTDASVTAIAVPSLIAQMSSSMPEVGKFHLHKNLLSFCYTHLYLSSIFQQSCLHFFVTELSLSYYFDMLDIDEMVALETDSISCNIIFMLEICFFSLLQIISFIGNFASFRCWFL